MFGGFAPPQFSKEELEHHEAEAASTVQFFFGAAVLLYLCMLPPSPQPFFTVPQY
ncbi:hypothetical protein F4811DRAFT_508375 [Daldinia bambusicola]|nr:hypothetical protein F4811DRAFT_508375 [Daldinia bambusicola]